MKRVLIVDDERDIRWILKNVLKQAGFIPDEVEDGKGAIKIVQKDPPDLVLLDLKMPDMNGMEVLEKMKKIDEEIPVIIITAYGDVKSAVKAMKLGAFDYISKPFDNEEIVFTIQKALNTYNLTHEVKLLRRRLGERLEVKGLMGDSEKTQQLLAQIKKVAVTDLTVVIQGESGTGKEIVAQLIHKHSKRSEKPFVAVDCGTLPENLVESELFGYEKGAFTGADRKKLGHFELAQEGTLFLDEISNLSKSTQSKLLRVLQEKKIMHLGGKWTIKVDVRIIAVSNINLDELVKKGQFRADLYHRLNQFTIRVLPLRDRKEDLDTLSNYFLKQANKEFSKKIKGFSSEAFQFLKIYNWPGNVRELINVVRRAVLIAEGIIQTHHLPLNIQTFGGLHKESYGKRRGKGGKIRTLKYATRKAMEEVERNIIKEILFQVKNNKVTAAKMLGIDRKSLYNKIHKYKL